jgi:SpoVK/Ycf46/Vps4 family AAA+-type ATPase
MAVRAALAMEHLRLRLRPLQRRLHQAVADQRQRGAELDRADLNGVCITDQQAQVLLAATDVRLLGEAGTLRVPEPDRAELQQEQRLREQAGADGYCLPWDALAEQLDLNDVERQAVWICAAPELDSDYERLYAYILDDLRRRTVSVELIARLLADGFGGCSEVRALLDASGRLRRIGQLNAGACNGSGLYQELQLHPRALAGLCGQTIDWRAEFCDAAEVPPTTDIHLPPQLAVEPVRRLAQALGSAHCSLVAVWGDRETTLQPVVTALAAWAQRPLRRWSAPADAVGEPAAGIESALRTARALGAILWLDLDSIADDAHPGLRTLLIRQLQAHVQPLVLTGCQPWRPTEVLARHAYAELTVPSPDHTARQQLWQRHLPAHDAEQIAGLALRYHMSETEMRAVSGVLRTQPHAAMSVQAALAQACSTVARRGASRFASLRVPRRGPEDLILPAQLHRQVMDVASFFRASARVDEDWGFGRMGGGAGGIKALFTGDSGTGKTLAAEVIAGALGLTLMKVDLARITSKWVGETEKNLESIFSEAQDSHSVLFFDEADALFARRSAVERSADRYANLEVGYLLQRLEDHRGLVVLASNLRDQIDEAFTRRFQFVVHFPRPGQAERRRLWHLAFPADAPLDRSIDFTPFTQLDMTGAAIVSTGRTAALLAADAGDEQIRSQHVVEAIARQFQMDARVLAPADLGPYAPLMQKLA